MLKRSKITVAVLLALGASAVAAAQSNPPAAPDNPTPTFRANVVSRTARAVNYGHHGGSTKINFGPGISVGGAPAGSPGSSATGCSRP